MLRSHACDKEERTAGLQQVAEPVWLSSSRAQFEGHPLEESTAQVDLNQESNESVVEGTCDDVVQHHTNALHDDLHASEDFKNIVPLVDIQRRFKRNNLLIEKPSKKPKTRDDDVSIVLLQ
ncbi:hypothetical protein Sjap_008034 [Stephania japonica]|uniref:Uncharacterized protein n=1 Tax=Stephania japonica TaxID=461633 RepID=A0AAP0PE79_9MAGN